MLCWLLLALPRVFMSRVARSFTIQHVERFYLLVTKVGLIVVNDNCCHGVQEHLFKESEGEIENVFRNNPG